MPTIEPVQFAIGDTLLFERSLPDFPADVWTLNYRFTNSSANFGFTATASGLDHLVNVTKATTALWTPAGDYQLNGYVTATVLGVPQQFSVYSGKFKLLPSRSDTTATDTRSWAAIALAAIETAITADMGRGSVIEYSINGRTFRVSYSDAMTMRDRLRSEVAQESWAGKNRKILTRFRSPR